MALTDRKKTLLSELALLVCGIVWGSAFAVLKNTLDYIPMNWLLTLRFFFAGLILMLVLRKRVFRANQKTLLGGIAAGACMYIAFLFQTIGLTMTTAGSNAFITAIYVVLVPFMQWAVNKKRPGARAVIAAVACFLGVGVIAMSTDFSIRMGDVWTLMGGVFFAAHIVVVAQFTAKGADVIALTCFQMFTTAVCAAAVAAFSEPLPQPESLFATETVLSMLYLILFSTVFCMGAQNISLRYAPASHAALLMGTEAPFGFLFGILLLDEPFTLMFLLGAALIAGSIVYSELGNAREEKRRQALRAATVEGGK